MYTMVNGRLVLVDYEKLITLNRMQQPSTLDGHPDPVVHHILRRLERVERKVRHLERERKQNYASQQNHTKPVQEFSEHVSIIGIKEFFSTKNVSVRFIWGLCFCICMTCMSYFVYKTFSEYLKEPTATKVKLVEQKEYDYPAILLCPDTWLDADKAFDHGLSLAGLQYALGYLINYFDKPPPYRIENYEQAQLDFERFYERRQFTDLVQFFKWISLDSEEFFYRCPFCRNESFEKILMSHTVCYQVPMQSTPGNAPVVSSLDFLEVIVPDRSRDLLRRRSFWQIYLGADLLLGEATRRHAEIYPHQSNTIQFVTHKFVSVNTQENPCLKSPEAPKNYSYARCVLQCYIGAKYEGQIFLMTACSSSTSDCDNSMLTPNVTVQFYSDDLWEVLTLNKENEKGEEAPEYCYNECRAFCDRMIYTMDVQSHPIIPIVDLSTQNQEQSLADSNSTIPQQKKKKNRGVGTPANLTRILFLNSAAVYGGVLTFEEVSTYSFETMVGNVGGMLSLWMGVSIMALIQMLMFFVTKKLTQRKGGATMTICKRSSTYDSALSPTMIRNSSVAGSFYSKSIGYHTQSRSESAATNCTSSVV